MLFADDSTLFIQGDTEQSALDGGKFVLERAQEWFASNRLLLNQSKTQNIMFSLRPIHLSDNPSHVRLLGFLMDPHFNWQEHIFSLSQRLASRLFLLNRLKNEVSPSTLLSAYYGLFHSILSYGLLLWGHSSYSHQIFVLQKKAIRILDKLPYNSHAKPSFIKLGILTLPSLYILQCAMHVKNNLPDYSTFSDVGEVEEAITTKRGSFENERKGGGGVFSSPYMGDNKKKEEEDEDHNNRESQSQVWIT
ncbi:hypothetical protein M8J77_023161 [Diaphorina citri]|nr:hypothetical protein M8J77_023161 [Diaphorina citri]